MLKSMVIMTGFLASGNCAIELLKDLQGFRCEAHQSGRYMSSPGRLYISLKKRSGSFSRHALGAWTGQRARVSASPTKRLCLTAFPTPHDRLLRDGYGLRRPSRPRSLVQRPPGRFTAFADDSTDGRDALQSASGRRSRATLRRTARPSSFWGA